MPSFWGPRTPNRSEWNGDALTVKKTRRRGDNGRKNDDKYVVIFSHSSGTMVNRVVALAMEGSNLGHCLPTSSRNGHSWFPFSFFSDTGFTFTQENTFGKHCGIEINWIMPLGSENGKKQATMGGKSTARFLSSPFCSRFHNRLVMLRSKWSYLSVRPPTSTSGNK